MNRTEGSDEADDNRIAELRQFYNVDQHGRYQNGRLHQRQKRFLFSSFLAIATTVYHAVKIVKKGVQLVRSIKQKVQRGKEIIGKIKAGVRKGKAFFGRVKDGIESLKDPTKRKRLLCKMAPTLEHGMEKLGKKALDKVDENYGTKFNQSKIFKPKFHLLQDKCKEKVEEEEAPATNEEMSETVNQVNDLGPQLSANSEAIAKNYEAVLENRQAIKENFEEIKKNGKAIEENARKLDVNKKLLEDNKAAIADNKNAILHNTDLLEKGLEEFKSFEREMRIFEKDVNEKFEKTFEHFKEIEKELRNIVLSIEVAKNEIIESINLTRKEIIENISKARIAPLISHLNIFFNHFTTQSNTLTAGTFQERISKLEEDIGILSFFENVMLPTPGTLHTLLNDIINQKLAIPANERDVSAVTMLELLNLGTLVYSAIIFFLIQQYSILLKYYSDKKDLKSFNRYYLRMFTKFKDFYIVLVNKGGFFDRVTSVFEEVQQLPYIDIGILKEKQTKLLTVNSIFVIEKLVQSMADTGRSLQLQIPEPLKVRLDFSQSNITTPVMDWNTGKRVRYAIQYYGRDNTTVPSMVSEWSKPYTVAKRGCPLISRIPIDPYNRIRLIYRQFDNDHYAKIVAILNNSLVTEFRDINRDLYEAAGEPNEEISLVNTKLFLGDKADPDAFFEDDRRAIHNAVENESEAVVKVLLKNKASVNVSDIRGFSPLHLATSANRSDIVQMLIESGANVNVQTIASSLGVSPLHIVAYKNFLEIGKLLLAHKDISVNIASSDGSTALHFASSFNRTAIVSLLLGDKRVQVNPQMNANKFTPLHVATVNNHTAVVKLLLQSSKVHVNSPAKDLSTPLHLAAVFKNVPITKQLLSAGANPVAKTAKGSMALHYAAVSGEQTVVKLLIEASKRQYMNDPNGEQSTPLYLAYQFNHTEIARVMLDNCANLNIRQKFGQSLLHVAAEKGHLMAVRNLLSAGLKYDQKDHLNNTPIHYAVARGHYSVARVILEAAGSLKFVNTSLTVNEMYQSDSSEGALFYTADKSSTEREKKAYHYENSTFNVFDYYHYMPLLVMASRLPVESDSFDMAELLVENGAKSKKKVTRALKTAIRQNYFSVTKLLLDNGAEITLNATLDMKNPEKSTLGEACAVEAVDINLVKLLFDHHALSNSDAPNNDPLMPIHEAAKRGNWEVLKYLVEEQGANINLTVPRKCKEGPIRYDTCSSVFDYAVESSLINLDIVKYFIGKKITYLKDYNLVINSFRSNREVAIFLVNNGTDVKSESAYKNHETALHSALREKICDRATIELLLRKGAQINVRKTDTQEVPLALAVEACDVDIVRFMIARGANYNVNGRNKMPFITLAAIQNNLPVVQYFNKSLDWPLPPKALFYSLYGKGETDIVLYFEANRPKGYLKRVRMNKQTLLHAALKANKTQVAQLLIYKGLFTPPDCGNSTLDGTYLHIAASQNNIEMTRYFVENGCKDAINMAGNHFNETPLSMAIARHGQLGVVNYLIEKGANLNQFYANTVYEGYSLLAQSIFRKKYDIAKMLIQKGVDMLTPSKKRENIILYKKKNEFVTESQPVTPQMLAMLRRNIDLLQLIINTSNVREYLPFQVAMKMKNYQALSYYLFNENPKTGQTVLHESISMGNLNEVSFILQSGAHVSAADKNQTTPLHLAASTSNLKVVQMLLKEKCIDLQAKDNKGRTPLDVAKETKNKEIIEAIEKASPKKLSTERKLSPSSDPIVNTANFDFNGTLLLLDTLIRSKTKKAYIPPPGSTGVTESNARVYALDLVEKFESLIEQISSQVGVSFQPPDSFKLYQSIEKAMLAGHFKNIDQLLMSAADAAFESSGPLSKPFRRLVHSSVDTLINSVQAQSTDQLAVDISSTPKINIPVTELQHSTTVKSIEATSKNQSINLIQ